jgi:hypothetical protein
MSPTFSHERRVFPRGYVAAVATVFVEQAAVGEYSVRDLSVGGALLVDGPPLVAGVACTLLLRMPGLGTLRISAFTVRGRDGPLQEVGVRFSELSPEVEDGLQQLVEQELERTAQPSVLVADANLQRMAITAEGLAELGERPLLAKNSLEVVEWLSDPATTIAVAFIAFDLRTRAGVPLHEFVRAEFSTVRCFVIDEPLTESELEQLLEQASTPPPRPSKLPPCVVRLPCTAH